MKSLIAIFLFSVGSYAATEHVVVMTDSRGNCGFGAQFIQKLHTLKDTSFKFYSVGGSSPRTWLMKNKRYTSPWGFEYKASENSKLQAYKTGKIRTPYFPTFLTKEFEKARTEKKTTIVVQGTNSLNAKDLYHNSIALIQNIHKLNSRCVWVGPPTFASFRANKAEWQVPIIEKAILDAGAGPNGQNCQFIDSTLLTYYPFTVKTAQRDGIHYCFDKTLINIAGKWANSVFDLIWSSNDS